MSPAIGCVAENTSKYLGQALRLVQSLRWFGGTLNHAVVYVCAIEGIDSHYREEFERLGAKVRVVNRFDPRHPQSNKLRFLELPELSQHDQVLLLDCDTIVVRDPGTGLLAADFCAKIADAPTVPLETFRNLFSAFSLALPSADQNCTVHGEATIPYFNAGVMGFSRKAMDVLVPCWIELNHALVERLEMLGEHGNFCEQASLALALAKTGIPFSVLTNEFNFPMHIEVATAVLGLTDIDPCIIHYHWLADASGNIQHCTYPAVNRRIDEFNLRLRQERESRFDNRLFWNQRYQENPELGSGIGSRGEIREYKRQLLADAVSHWRPSSILDVGCGDLEVGSILPATGYLGLDYSEVVIAANFERYPDRRFISGNFLTLPNLAADMVICLDVLIHMASSEECRSFVRRLVESTRRVGIVAGDESDPGLGGIVFFHEPLSRMLAKAGACNIRKLGSYRHLTIFEYTTPHPAQRDALLILGMHRSGTSALAGVLSMAGADPSPSLMPAMAEVNPKGFWEHQDIVAIHERLLDTLNSSWDDERPLPHGWWKLPEIVTFRSELLAVLHRDFSASPLWLLKDPRLCRLLPLWLEILNDFGATPHFVICLRHPGEVAKSLERRDDIQAARANLLWLQHLMESERWTRDLPRVAITYEQLLDDWRTVLQHIAVQLSIDLSYNDTTTTKINVFLEPALRHHHHSQTKPAVESRFCTLASEAFTLAADDGLDSTIARFETIRAEAANMVDRVVPWSTEIRALRKKNATLNTFAQQLAVTNANVQAEIIRVKATVSWQVTKPLRFLAYLWRKLVHANRLP